MSGGVSRRSALQTLGVGLSSIAIGCGDGSEDDTDTPGGTTPKTPSDNTTPPTDVPPGDSGPLPTTPKELLGNIEHIVVLMMENRSFDHFLGSLARDAAYPARAVVDGLKGTESNPSSDGTTEVALFKLTNFTPVDPPHDWDSEHTQFNGGKNDGFVRSHAGEFEHEVMGYHDRSQLPLYYWFADNFTVCDRWFASLMGPTWPNRFYLHAATSAGIKDNSPILNDVPDTIWDRLDDKGISAKNFAAGTVTFFVGGFPTKAINGPSASINEFFEAAISGELPAFSLIDPDFEASDDHPAHNIQRGQAFVASIYRALAASPAWKKTLFIITYDENGGFFDHVPPPTTVDINLDFAQLGFRVPAFVIGPTVKKAYVSKVQYDHSSVAKTLQTRFGIDSLSKRMDAAHDVADCIDPAKVRAPGLPPPGMPQIAMTRDAALNDAVGFNTQPGLAEAMKKSELRVNPADHSTRIEGWLEHAVRLGAVRLV